MGMWDSYQGMDSLLKGMGGASEFGMGDQDVFGMLKQFMQGQGAEGSQQFNMTGYPTSNPSGGAGNPSAWAAGGTAPRAPMTQLGKGGMFGGGGANQLIRILQMLLAQSGASRQA